MVYAIPISIVIEGSYGKNLLACLVGGTSCGALGETLTSLDFLVKDQVKLIFFSL
jgi:hypothetical protein